MAGNLYVRLGSWIRFCQSFFRNSRGKSNLVLLGVSFNVGVEVGTIVDLINHVATSVLNKEKVLAQKSNRRHIHSHFYCLVSSGSSIGYSTCNSYHSKKAGREKSMKKNRAPYFFAFIMMIVMVFILISGTCMAQSSSAAYEQEYRTKANELLAAKNYEQAASVLEELLAKNPDLNNEIGVQAINPYLRRLPIRFCQGIDLVSEVSRPFPEGNIFQRLSRQSRVSQGETF